MLASSSFSSKRLGFAKHCSNSCQADKSGTWLRSKWRAASRQMKSHHWGAYLALTKSVSQVCSLPSTNILSAVSLPGEILLITGSSYCGREAKAVAKGLANFLDVHSWNLKVTSSALHFICTPSNLCANCTSAAICFSTSNRGIFSSVNSIHWR